MFDLNKFTLVVYLKNSENEGPGIGFCCETCKSGKTKFAFIPTIFLF